MLAEFFDKKSATIVVTDSGLGGLSVAANLAARLPESGIFQHVRIVFFNSLFHERSGYNSLKTEAERIQIFNQALKSMSKKYHPGLLLIACNTLSVIYQKTHFYQKSKFPIIGIVEIGVDLIAQEFDRNPEANVIIFATRTTIESNAHKNALIERGYSEDRIVGQACHKLAGAIERGYDSEETNDYIRKYVSEALVKLNDPHRPLFASLNCTHFGYSIQQFKDAFAKAGYAEIKIIDPNPRMADFLFQPPYLHRYLKTFVDIEVVSKTKITPEEINSLAKLLQQVSPATTQAFANYRYDPELFIAHFDTTTIEQ